MRVLLVCLCVGLSLGSSSCARLAKARADRPSHEVLAGATARPVVLVHGFSGFGDFGFAGQYFLGVKAHYEAQGVPVYAPALPPYASSEERGRFVARTIDEALLETGADKVHIIGHSQGGLDARYAISERGLGYASKVASLTTVSTPHEGTPVADFALLLPRALLDVVFVPMQLVMGAPEGEDLGAVRIVESLTSMSTADARRFNAEHPDPPGVALFSVATVSGDKDTTLCRQGKWALEGWDAPSLYLTPTWLLLAEDPDPAHRTPNDGVVPAASAVRGTFLGCVAADHLEVVGFDLEVENDQSRPFDRLALYDALLKNMRDVDGGLRVAQTKAAASLVEMRRESP